MSYYSAGLRGTTKRIIKSARVINGNISEIFRHSFNVRIRMPEFDYLPYNNFFANRNSIWNFHIDEKALSVFSILIHEKLLDVVEKEMKITITEKGISIDKIKLVFEHNISEPEPPALFSNEITAENVFHSEKYLQSIGRRSSLTSSDSTTELSKKLFEINNSLPDINLAEHSNFFGIGEGLTPSSDDYVTGLLLADRICGRKTIQTPDSFFQSVLLKSNLISVQQLFFASESKSAIKLEEFVHNFCNNKIDAVSISSIIGIGNFSGTDILSGITEYFKKIIH